MKKTLLPLLLSLIVSSISLMAQPHPPMMGWSSWNTYRVHINDSLICRQADLMVERGLKSAGYNFVNIDDGFQGGRSADGRLLTHPTRFPNGLRSVTDHIHNLGLKAGIYSDAGRNTCGNYYDNDTLATGVGFYGHDDTDARFYFEEMNFDFIKIDFCGGDAGQNRDRLALDEQERYTDIRRAIQATRRQDVRLNVCRWDYPGTWVGTVADSWRTTPDIRDYWSSIRQIIAQNLYLSAYSSPGHYNDMDMLEVGRRLSHEEDRTHFAMWCMMCSPLLIGCDLATLDSTTLALLTHDELIALNQRPPLLQAYPADHSRGAFLLTKDIRRRHGKERAVAVYNPQDQPTNFTIRFRSLDLASPVKVRDVMARKELGTWNDSLTVEVPAHGVRILTTKGKRRLDRKRYEAETGYIACYQELANPLASQTGYYVYDDICSSGMKAVNLGGKASNSLFWNDVSVSKTGLYRLEIMGTSNTPRSIMIDVNGHDIGRLTTQGQGKSTMVIKLKKGLNTLRLHNDDMPMPDIDYLDVCPID